MGAILFVTKLAGFRTLLEFNIKNIERFIYWKELLWKQTGTFKPISYIKDTCFRMACHINFD